MKLQVKEIIKETDDAVRSFLVNPKKEIKEHYVLFAGGSGITPILSILKSVLLKEPLSKIVLVYANQNIESIIFKEDIEKLEKEYPATFSVEHILSKSNQENANYHSGLLTEELLTSIIKKHKLIFGSSQYMICGPFGFMECTKGILIANGVKLSNIKVEVFKSPTNNIALPYSCRSGMCSTCKASCSKGEVVMTEGHFMGEDEVSQGKILTCISYPASKNVVINI